MFNHVNQMQMGVNQMNLMQSPFGVGQNMVQNNQMQNLIQQNQMQNLINLNQNSSPNIQNNQNQSHQDQLNFVQPQVNAFGVNQFPQSLALQYQMLGQQMQQSNLAPLFNSLSLNQSIAQPKL